MPGKGQSMKAVSKKAAPKRAHQATTTNGNCRPCKWTDAGSLVQRCDGESLWISDGVLTLQTDGVARTVSVHAALCWWLESIESQSRNVSSDPRGEWEFFRHLTQGLFVPLSAAELAGARLCANRNNFGDLAAWAKGWIAGGIESDLEDVSRHCN